MKQLGAGVAIGILLTILFSVATEKYLCAPETTRDTTWIEKTATVNRLEAQLDSVQAVASTERVKSKRNLRAADFYRRLADSLSAAKETTGVDIPSRELHTQFPNDLDTLIRFDNGAIIHITSEYGDSLSLKYIFPPIDVFANLRFRRAPINVVASIPEITVTETRYRTDWRLVGGASALAVLGYVLLAK